MGYGAPVGSPIVTSNSALARAADVLTVPVKATNEVNLFTVDENGDTVLVPEDNWDGAADAGLYKEIREYKTGLRP
jgi:hypothetical protein